MVIVFGIGLATLLSPIINSSAIVVGYTPITNRYEPLRTILNHYSPCIHLKFYISSLKWCVVPSWSPTPSWHPLLLGIGWFHQRDQRRQTSTCRGGGGQDHQNSWRPWTTLHAYVYLGDHRISPLIIYVLYIYTICTSTVYVSLSISIGT